MKQPPQDTSRRSTLGSYDEEVRDLMWTRTRLICLLGIALSIPAVPLTLMIEGRSLAAEPMYRGPLIYAHFVLFAVAFALIPVLRNRVSAAWLVVPLLSLNLAASITRMALYQPDQTPDLGIALMLFLHAAFLPSYTSQIALSIIAVVLSIGIPVLTPLVNPSVAAFWDGPIARVSFSTHLVSQATGSVFLAIIATIASRTLYTLGRAAHRVKRLGSYVVEGKLGSGGMGDVYLARHAMIRRPTAVKVLRHEAGDAEALARFEREVQVSAALTHPNTVRVFDFGRTPDGTFYYAMEYLLGLDLQDLIDAHGPVDPSRCVFIMKQICGSLAEAHRHGVVHRDIKPSNIFITEQGGLHDFVKVLDFGLARKVSPGDDGLTKAGALFGTPTCFAPEGMMGVEGLDGRADIYAAGCVLYWMLVGEPVFPGINAMEVIMDHVKKTPETPSERAIVNVPEALSDIAMKCLEKDPRDRFQTFDELGEALDAAGIVPAWDQKRAKAWWDVHPIERPTLEDTGELEIAGRAVRAT